MKQLEERRDSSYEKLISLLPSDVWSLAGQVEGERPPSSYAYKERKEADGSETQSMTFSLPANRVKEKGHIKHA